MAVPTKFIFTDHGCERAQQRGISHEQFKDCILHPTGKRLQRKGENGGNVYHLTKTHGEYTLHVIAEIRKETCWIVTGFWENK